MFAIRRVASWLLTAIVRHSSAESRSWANAMLREMDFVESDGTALFWALGSATALCRHSISQRLRMGFDGCREALSLKDMARRTPAILSVVVVPEAVYVVSAVALWRQRKSMALGILAAGMILITHAIVHFATHG